MNIEISKEDLEFLKDLQHELNTQDNDETADPLYWGVLEEKEEYVPEGCGEPRISHDDGSWTLEEAVESVNEVINEYDQDTQDALKEVWKDDAEDVCNFMRETLKWDFCDVYYVEKVDRISNYSGAFLTKRACKQHIEKNHYHYDNPRTYAMCAYRNYELERLLKILKTIKLE
jgi:hypothetical protein